MMVLSKIILTPLILDALPESVRFNEEIRAVITKFSLGQWDDIDEDLKEQNEKAWNAKKGVIIAYYKTCEGPVRVLGSDNWAAATVSFAHEICF
jgi:hypothetical protein